MSVISLYFLFLESLTYYHHSDEQLDFVDVEALDNWPSKNEAIKNAQVIGVGHHHDLQPQLTGPNGIQHHVIPGSDSGQTPINKEAIIIDERTNSHVQQTDNYGPFDH